MGGQQQAPAGAQQLVSVVIPVRNEEAAIEACLRSVLAQTVRTLEVLVVDGQSTDGTRAAVLRVAASDDRVRLLVNPERRIPAALNTGLDAACGRWLVRVDAHSTIPPDYIARVCDHLSSGQWGGVGGRKDGTGESATGRAIAAALGSPFGVGNSVYHYGTSRREVDHIPFGAYPTALLRSMGGWEERLEANEDYELDDRLRRHGQRLLFDPAVRISWQSRETLRALFAQYRRYGRGKAHVLVLRPRSVKVRHLAAPALVVDIAAAAVLSPRRPRVAAGLLVPYVVALAVASVRVGRKLDGAARWRLPAAFVAMHLGWGVGFWRGIARHARARGRR